MHNTPIADTVLNDCSEVASALATPKSMEIIANLFHKDKNILLLAGKCASGEELSEKEIDVLLSELNGEKGQKLERYLNMHKEEYLRVIGKKEEAEEFNDHAFFTNEGEPTLQKLIGHLQLLKTQAQEKLGSEGVQVMNASMKSRNETMTRNNNGCDATDMESISKMKLSMRKEGGINIINLPEFGEFASTTSMNAEYRDMDKSGTRNPAHLSQSPKLKTLTDKVSGLKLMSEDRIYELMTIVAKGLGINNTIDQAYIDDVYTKYPNSNLPKDHPLGRIGRAMSVMLGDWFVIPISVNGKVVRSFDCNDYICGVYDSSLDYYDVAPLAEIGGSPTT